MEPISRVPIVQQVEERIRELIQEEQYQPGKKLPPEMELCQRLGVGRGTVREAFRLLQAKGVVEIKPGRGAFVAENPAERDIGAIDWLVENERELRDSIEIRTALEPMAARRMAERCNTEDIRRLENIHRSFLSAIQEGDAAMIGRLDEQFHSAIVESSGNALMIEIKPCVPGNADLPQQDLPGGAEREERGHAPQQYYERHPGPGCRPGGAGDAGPSGQGPGGSDPEHPCPGTRDKIIGTAQPGSLRPPAVPVRLGDFFCVPAEKRTRSGSGSGVLDVPGRRAGSRGKPALYNMLRNLRKRESRAEISTKMREEFCRLFPLTS